MRANKVVTTAVVALALSLGLPMGLRARDDYKKREKAHTYLIRARAAAAKYDINKASSEAKKALKNNPNIAEAHVYVGLLHLRKNKLEKAEAEFRRALEIDSYQAGAHCYLGYIHYLRGDFERALDELNLAVKLDSTSPHAYAGLALSLFKTGREEDAARTYEKALIYDRRFTDIKFLQKNEEGAPLEFRADPRCPTPASTGSKTRLSVLVLRLPVKPPELDERLFVALDQGRRLPACEKPALAAGRHCDPPHRGHRIVGDAKSFAV